MCQHFFLQCDAGVGIDRFFHAIYSKKRILMLLGSGEFSNVTEALANVVPYWNVLQVILSATSIFINEIRKLNKIVIREFQLLSLYYCGYYCVTYEHKSRN